MGKALIAAVSCALAAKLACNTLSGLAVYQGLRDCFGGGRRGYAGIVIYGTCCSLGRKTRTAQESNGEIPAGRRSCQRLQKVLEQFCR